MGTARFEVNQSDFYERILYVRRYELAACNSVSLPDMGPLDMISINWAVLVFEISLHRFLLCKNFDEFI